MIALARRLNPEIRYVKGDMRTVRLEDRFDSVALLDAVNYMLSEDDLAATFQTAFHHLKRGGVLLTFVEALPEQFEQNRTTAENMGGRSGVEVVFIENCYDPDPADTTYEATHVHIIRDRGKLRIETDSHLCGIFPLETWLRLLGEVGFKVQVVPDEPPSRIPILVCRRPA